MPTPELPLTTSRLVLRPFVPEDAEALYKIQSREDVTKYLYWGPRTREEVRQVVADRMTFTTLNDVGDRIVLAVQLRATGELLGDVNLGLVSAEHRTGEIGYIFHPDHHGHGYANEAALEILRVGFEVIGLHRIVARLDADNTASANLAERLGMRKEAHFRKNEFVQGRWADEAVYALLAEEWKAR
ncbi:GNAT family protein [Actinokineospora auranticolor]|uniref:RimJ/RimL family protein N-acetyltransferase n=1 Tax=Actinokineospora auranticolor TaxID=155976 RepID=A0A2S6GWT9_9PSEU|nr:GNAT family protein [Actinokineospora auranticolor]PPK69679.1 RimJ/RimL family protein N-acetyltransferase [Actinokineospora auranticolor]